MKRSICAFLTLLAIATQSQAADPVLTPVADRITDGAIAADKAAFSSVYKRIRAINEKGTPLDNYHLAKALAWLDFAADEYNENDRSSVIEEALGQCLVIVNAFEAGMVPADVKTTIIPSSMRIRKDLWEKTETMKGLKGYKCAAGTVARLEVQLVWAGHEESEMGWRHSRPYILAAERYAREAETQIAACPEPQQPKPAPEPAACPVCPPAIPPPAAHPQPPAPKQQEPIGFFGTIPAMIHFAFDSSHVSSESAAILNRLLSVLQTDPVLAVELQGHADDRGTASYNNSLSLRRADAVRSHLVAAGISRNRISVKAFGESKPLVTDKTVEGLARNRRVEFVLSSKEYERVPQEDDLQLESPEHAPEKKGSH